MRVLVVQGDPEIGAWFRTVLQKTYGYEVTVVLNSFEDIFLWDNLEVEAVICDWELGSQVAGGTILSYMLQNFPSVRRVVLTDAPTDEMNRLAHAILKKPLTVESLFKVLGLSFPDQVVG